MKGTREMLQELREYRGQPLCFMEVCGSHTAAIARSGIRDLLPEGIRLISGPGCPVCVTASAYIDRLIELACEENTTVVTFGDLIRVPGGRESLAEAKGRGASVRMVYSPMDVIPLAGDSPDRQFVFAAIGFETTIPVYALLLDALEERGIGNVKLLTSLKTMIPALKVLSEEPGIDGFLAPGHVSVIIGSRAYQPLAAASGKPFAVAGFRPEELVRSIYGLSLMARAGLGEVRNFYPSVVRPEGNVRAWEKTCKYFEPGDAVWRGLGRISGSGMYLKEVWQRYDAGSRGLDRDRKRNPACRCGEILTGRAEPRDCPLFGTVCNEQHPQGACMVSEEGSCAQAAKA